MSKADIERFVADLNSDAALLEEVKAAAGSLSKVVDVAKAKGYDITVDEAKAYIEEQAKQELSDEQLDAVAGGKTGGGGGIPVMGVVPIMGGGGEVAMMGGPGGPGEPGTVVVVMMGGGPGMMP